MTIGHDTRHWLIRYKLYHLPFWLVYNYLTWVIMVGNPVKAAHDLFYFPFTVKYLVYVLVQAMAAYFNLYFLIPRYLEKSKYFLYTLFVMLTVAAASLVIVPVYYFAAFLAHSTTRELFGKDACWFTFFSNAMLTTLQHDPGDEHQTDKKLAAKQTPPPTPGKRKTGDRAEFSSLPVQPALSFQYHQLHLLPDP